MYVREHSLFPADSSSATTSAAYYVGDFFNFSIQFGSASTVTLQGTNADGLTSALAEGDWSTLSVVAAAGLQKVETGFRWLRAVRSQSTNTLRTYGWSESRA
jgi:hypothetical protein